MHGFQAVLIDMCINLRRADVAMAEQFLNDAQVGSAADQVGCETVPQCVGGDLAEDSAGSAVFFDEHPEADALERFSASR